MATSKLRGGIGNTESVLISVVEETGGPAPAAKPSRVQPHPRHVNTLIDDEEDFVRGWTPLTVPATKSVEEAAAAALDKAHEAGVDVHLSFCGDKFVVQPGEDEAELVNRIWEAQPDRHPVGETATDIPAMPAQAATTTTTIVTPAENANPVTRAINSAVKARVRKLALIFVLAVPTVFTAAALIGMFPMMTILIAWSATLLLGGPVKSLIESGVMECLTLRLWVEVVAVAFLIGATVLTTGVIWQWSMTAGLVTCMLHRLVFTLQAAKDTIAVVEEVVAEEEEAA